jgi:uncharacterized membrane protein
MYSGPLPTAKEFGGYEQALPGAANRILSMAEKQAEHRQTNEDKLVEHSIRKSGRGQLFAFVIALISLGVVFYSILKGEPLGAIVPAIIALSGLVAVFASKKQS